ncbi:MAG TPA: protein kinase [Sandaracinaceae bacterium LLY-WYZ-13_1]|nr:protein kinase [Sandaracinaceae bacterium LLY-WYZ-13_1]
MGIPDAESSALGPYTLLETVGEGGFARVHRVVADGRELALKVLLPEAAARDPKAHARFEREIRALERVRHPHLIELVDHGVDPARGPWLVTPLVTGVTLRDLGGRLCPEAALLLLEPVAAALGALHEAGLVHRDLKPENVMVTPLGEVVLVDLGLALADAHSRLTEAGAVTGSVPYMSPEQIEGEAIGPSSDVWSWAVTFYELVAGRRPFERERPGEELASILAGPLEPLAERERRVSPALGALIDRCLSRDPFARPADGAALAELLAPHLAAVPRAERKAERTAVVTDPPGYPARVAPRLVRELADRARERAAAGRPLEAIRVLDRALAYDPDADEVVALLDEVTGRVGAEDGVGEDGAARSDRAASAGGADAHRRRRARGAGAASVDGTDARSPAGASVADGRPGRRPSSSVDASRPVPSGGAAVGRDGSTGLVGWVARRRWLAALLVGLAVAGGAWAWVGSGPDGGADGAAAADGPGERGARDDPATERAAGADEDPDEAPEPEGVADVAQSPLPPELPDALASLAPLPEDRLRNDDPRRPADDVPGPGEPLVGRDRIGGREPAEVLEELGAQLETHPDDMLTRLRYALALLAAGRPEDGLARLDALGRTHPNDARVLDYRALVAYHQGREAEAERLYSRAIEVSPERGLSWRNRGVLRHRAGRTRDAYRDLMAALRRDPDDVDALAELARIYEGAGRLGDAEPLLARIVELRPEWVPAWVDLSLAQPDPEDQLASVRRALELSPRDPRANLRRCEVLSTADPRAAIAACDEAERLRPRDFSAPLFRGLAHARLDENEAAVADLDRAIALQPRAPEPYHDRALVRRALGEDAAARSDFQAACRFGHRPSCSEL